MILEISDTQRTNLSPFLHRHLLAAHHLLQPPLSDLSIALVDSRTMARLHWHYLKIKGPTDVLTFELEHDSREHVSAGEIIVCVPFARRSAAGNGVLLRQELLLYCLHGMLHLCGHDDKMQRGFNRMHRKEDEILTQLGIGPVFRSVKDSLGIKTGSKGTIR